MDIFGNLITIGGLPFALVCLAVLALVRGDVVIKKSHEALIQEKDQQIQRERERGSELWQLLQPAIVIGKASLDKLERNEQDGRDRSRNQDRDDWDGGRRGGG